MTKKKAGFSLIDFLVTMVVMVLCLGLAAPMIHTTAGVWNQVAATSGNKELLSQAVLKLSPTLRDAMMVNVSQSTSSQLYVILPKQDPVSGDYVYPLTQGNTVSFYLSDITGSPSVKGGTILWRSINGVPDSSWSLIGGQGRINFGASQLSFSFDNSSDPALVTINVNSSLAAGDQTETASAAETILLRNHQIGGF